MKRVSWLRWVLFMFIAISNINSSKCLSLPGIVLLGHKGSSSITMTTHNRKVLEKIYSPGNVKSKGETNENVSLDDYSPIDPVPTSKATIKSGPIQQGTPLMPYIPKPPASPFRPKQGLWKSGYIWKEWVHLERNHSNSVLGVVESTRACSLRLPVVCGAKVNMQNLKDAISSAVDVMQAMSSSVCSLLSKVEEVNKLVVELANVSVLERALLHQCRDLLSRL